GGGLAFLPFRDSNEAVDPDVAEGDLLTRQIYEMDVTAIRRSYAVVALLNDPQKDSGVCFEVGYAAALGRPIMPVVNDFIDRRYEATDRALDEATREDIVAAVGADLLVTLGDGADMDAGSAAIQGLARGFNRRVLLYYSGALRWVAGSRDAEERNLMLQHSAD